MAVNISYDHEDDDYIDMEVSSYSSFFCNSESSIPQAREFEFQMSSVSFEKDSTTSPADELFYKGKLLPLHLPPRLQMVEKLLQHSNSPYDCRKNTLEEFFSTPLMTTATTPTTTSTPFESCNISPSESCRVSRELNPAEYFFEYSNEEGGFNGENRKKTWTKKLKLIKQSSLSSRLKASRAYLKSLFGKSGCSDDSCTAASKVADEGIVSKPSRKVPFGQIQKENFQLPTTRIRNGNKQKISSEDEDNSLHRRSFSMALRRHSTNKSSSSSSSSTNTNGFYGLPFIKRSSSVNLEVENPIQEAIAHCKQSHQQLFCPRKAEIELCRG